MNVGIVKLPAVREAGSVEACAAPLAYLAWLAWPGEDQKADRDSCFLGGLASIAKASNVPRPEFPHQMKGKKPERVDNKVNRAFDIIYRKRWRAVSMLLWKLDGLSTYAATERLVEWSYSLYPRQPEALVGIEGDYDEGRPSVRKRIWRESISVLPMAWGFFHANGFMRADKPLPKKIEILTTPDWVPVAVNRASEMAETVSELHPDTKLILPQIA